MRKSATMFISSITGNTRLIANNLIEELHQSGWRVHLYRKGNIVPKENLVILCFWCRRSSIESTTLNFLRSIRGRKVIAFCTMGGNPNSPYGLRVRENIRMEIELITPIAMDEGLRFAIREGGRTVASGVVTGVIE